MSEKQPAVWRENETESFPALLCAIGETAADRLVIEQLGPELDRMTELVRRAAGQGLAFAVGTFADFAIVEAQRTGIKIGLYLATVVAEKSPLQLGSFEDVLQAALTAAGLREYKPNIEFKEP